MAVSHDVARYRVYREHTTLKSNDVETLLCPLCGGILQEPSQVITCGHRYCRGCLEKFMDSSGDVYKCPVDNEEFEPSQVRKDKGCQRELQSLEIECTTQPTPCEWRGPLTKLEVHLSECPNMEVECPLGCGGCLLKSQLSSHVSSQCPNRPVECQYCKTSVPQSHLEAHVKECPNVEIDCPLGCGGCLLKSQLSSHVSSQCPNRPVECQYCKTSVPQSHLERHFELCSNDCEYGSPIPLSSKEVEGPLVSDSRQRDKPQAEMVVGSFESKTQASKIPTEAHGRGDIAGDLSKRVNEMTRTMDAHGKQILKMEESLQDMKKMIQCMCYLQAVMMNRVHRRPDTLATDTPESAFIWGISNFSRRLRDARNGRTTSIYSSPFYTHSHGYKMCIRTYLNGDGIGKGTHMSVFFVLMRSEHDRLLSYPFKQSVRFTLINQVEPRASITETFRPDLTSSSFQRPQTDMNVASGFPKFAHQSVFCDEAFTKGDVIFIKCQVEKDMYVVREYPGCAHQNAVYFL